jgi:hypothetical protein
MKLIACLQPVHDRNEPDVEVVFHTSSEQNAVEANFASVAMYVAAVGFWVAVGLELSHPARLITIALSPVLAVFHWSTTVILTWIATTPLRHVAQLNMKNVQNVSQIIVLAAMSIFMATRTHPIRWIGIAIVSLIAVNIMLLPFVRWFKRPGEASS